jgi:hypothetical protein
VVNVQQYKPTTPAAWQEELDERAAIAEYLGGLSRADAEQLALEIVGPRPESKP